MRGEAIGSGLGLRQHLGTCVQVLRWFGCFGLFTLLWGWTARSQTMHDSIAQLPTTPIPTVSTLHGPLWAADSLLGRPARYTLPSATASQGLQCDTLWVDGVLRPDLLRQFRAKRRWAQWQQLADQWLWQQANEGHPLAYVRFVPVAGIGQAYTIQCFRGKALYYGQLRVWGIGRNTGVFEAISQIRPGGVFRYRHLDRLGRSLGNPPLWQQQASPRVFVQGNTAHVNLYLKSLPTSQFDALLGLQTTANGQATWQGNLLVRLHNTLQRAERFVLQWNKTPTQQQGQVEVALPYLWRSPWGVAFDFGLQQIDSTWQSLQFGPALSFAWASGWHIQLGYQGQRAVVRGLGSGMQGSQSQLLGLRLGHQYSTAANNAQRAFVLDMNLMLGQRRMQATEAESKLMAHAETDLLWPLRPMWLVRTALRGALLWHASGSYLEAELPATGGLRSIRGYYENELRVPWHASATAELRFRPNEASYFATFIDAGVVPYDRASALRYPLGVGAGMGFRTKAGMLHVLYALPWQAQQVWQWTRGKLHVGLASYF